MSAIKLQLFFQIFCIFLSFRAQISLGMKVITVENPQSDILSKNNNLSHEDRILTTQLNPCNGPNCQQFDSINDQSSSYEYSVEIAGSSKITFTFSIGSDETSLYLTLNANPVVGLKTDIKLNPSSSYPGNYINTLVGIKWKRRLLIDSASTSRTLTVEMENTALVQSTNVRFEISIDNSLMSKPWMAPVITVICAVFLIIVAIFGLLRIRKRRIQRRRMRAQAAYEVAMCQYIDTEYNQPINFQAPQNQHFPAVQTVEMQQNYPMGFIEMQNRGENGDPLSKENFDQRFPERSSKMFKSSFPQKTCSICLENLGRFDKCRQLYCEHIFHSECVKLWLINQVEKQKNGFCPNCNKKMTFVIENAKQSL